MCHTHTKSYEKSTHETLTSMVQRKMKTKPSYSVGGGDGVTVTMRLIYECFVFCRAYYYNICTVDLLMLL